MNWQPPAIPTRKDTQADLGVGVLVGSESHLVEGGYDCLCPVVT